MRELLPQLGRKVAVPAGGSIRPSPKPTQPFFKSCLRKQGQSEE
jgi:hypothetical protein